MAVYRKRTRRTLEKERPYVFPALKVDEQTYQNEITIQNVGQGLDAALREAVQMVRDKRAEQDVESDPIPVSGDVEEVVEEDFDDAKADDIPTAGDEPMEVDVSPVQSTAPTLAPDQVEAVVVPWLQANLPNNEALQGAAAAMNGLLGIELRVQQVLAGMKAPFAQVSNEFRQWFTTAKSDWDATTLKAATALTDWNSQVAETESWRAGIEISLREYVRSLRGPTGARGAQGNWGAVCLVSDKTPSGADASLMQRFIDRDAIKGDTLIDGTNKMRYAWMFDGTAFQRGPSMVTMEIRDIRVQANDFSNKTKISQSITKITPGSSGGGAEALKARTIQRAVATEIADSSNWVGISGATEIDPTSGFIRLGITPTDAGPQQGKHGSCTLWFNSDGLTNFQWTDAADLGDITQWSINLSITRVAPVDATGAGPAYPAGTLSTRIALTIDGALNGHQQFEISGGTYWDKQALGNVIGPMDSSIQPRWIWE